MDRFHCKPCLADHDSHFQGFYAFIEFSSRDSVAEVLRRNGQHFLHHRRLQVRQKQVKRAVLRRKRNGYKQAFRDAEQPIINHDELLSKLQKQDTVSTYKYSI